MMFGNAPKIGRNVCTSETLPCALVSSNSHFKHFRSRGKCLTEKNGVFIESFCFKFL
jgi:hypothetical protein